MLPNIIHSNYNAFAKGRSIFDALRTIEFWLFLYTLDSNFTQKALGREFKSEKVIHCLHNLQYILQILLSNKSIKELKILAIKILRDDRNIQGFKIEQEILEISTFADDDLTRKKWIAIGIYLHSSSDFEYCRQRCLSSITQLFRQQQSLVALLIWLPKEFLR